MPLVNGDYKSMEWETAVYLSQDEVAKKELENNVDQHADNQARQGFPQGKEGRLIAKIFLFRLIFGGTAFAYANDPDFNYLSDKATYWQKAIDVFYEKYQGLYTWHTKIVQEVMETGQYVLPTGRVFYYKPYEKRGEWIWPRTKILNYPVQGLGGDLMVIARVAMWRRMRKLGMKSKMIGTVHDSILVDSPNDEVDQMVQLFYEVWDDIPKNFERMFGVEYNLKPKVEVQVGPNWKNMEDRFRSN